MNKSDLIAAIAEQANLTKTDTGRALESILSAIEHTLKAGDSVTLGGLGGLVRLLLKTGLNGQAVIRKLARKSLSQGQKFHHLRPVKV